MSHRVVDHVVVRDEKAGGRMCIVLKQAVRDPKGPVT